MEQLRDHCPRYQVAELAGPLQVHFSVQIDPSIATGGNGDLPLHGLFRHVRSRPAATEPAARSSVVAPVRRPDDGLDGHPLPCVTPAAGAACTPGNGYGECESLDHWVSHPASGAKIRTVRLRE